MPAAAPALPNEERAPPRVLIIDDSAVARAVMARLIDGSDRFMVVGAVASAAAARDLLARTAVDLIILDLELPGVDGLTALPDLLAGGNGARILVVSSSAKQGAAATVQALALGAADTLVKPGAAALSSRFGTELLERLERLAEKDDVPALPPRATLAASAPVPALGEHDIVAIGASTGGMHALSALLRALPPAFRLPILVTQHLPASFMPYFAAQLAVIAGRPCEVATDHLRVRPGRIVVAPGDAHIRCVALADGGIAIRLAHGVASSGCLPSVDPMLASVAEVYGARALAIVLSGMGRDGAEGARLIRAAGGTVLVQDRASSVVWGMPGTVAEQGNADAVLPPEAIGALLARRPS